MQQALARSLEIDEKAWQSARSVAAQRTAEQPAAERSLPSQPLKNQRRDDAQMRPQRVTEAPIGTASASRRSNGASPSAQSPTMTRPPPPPPQQEDSIADFYETDSDSLNSEPDAEPDEMMDPRIAQPEGT
jgi:hypothetical protein